MHGKLPVRIVVSMWRWYETLRAIITLREKEDVLFLQAKEAVLFEVLYCRTMSRLASQYVPRDSNRVLICRCYSTYVASDTIRFVNIYSLLMLWYAPSSNQLSSYPCQRASNSILEPSEYARLVFERESCVMATECLFGWKAINTIYVEGEERWSYSPYIPLGSVAESLVPCPPAFVDDGDAVLRQTVWVLDDKKKSNHLIARMQLFQNRSLRVLFGTMHFWTLDRCSFWPLGRASTTCSWWRLKQNDD